MSDARKVPREPTLEMLQRGGAVYNGHGPNKNQWGIGDIWRAMYDAAPAQAEPREPPVQVCLNCGAQTHGNDFRCFNCGTPYAAPSPAAEDDPPLSLVARLHNTGTNFVETKPELGQLLHEAAARIERQAQEIAELTADRDSWADQASERAKDAVQFIAERDAALRRAEALREALQELVACDEIVKHGQHDRGEKVKAGRWARAWEAARAALASPVDTCERDLDALVERLRFLNGSNAVAYTNIAAEAADAIAALRAERDEIFELSVRRRAEIIALRASRDQCQNALLAAERECNTLTDENAALRARAERAEADAARYRWLRDHGEDADLLVYQVRYEHDEGYDHSLLPDELDAAIDRARTQGGDE